MALKDLDNYIDINFKTDKIKEFLKEVVRGILPVVIQGTKEEIVKIEKRFNLVEKNLKIIVKGVNKKASKSSIEALKKEIVILKQEITNGSFKNEIEKKFKNIEEKFQIIEEQSENITDINKHQFTDEQVTHLIGIIERFDKFRNESLPAIEELIKQSTLPEVKEIPPMPSSVKEPHKKENRPLQEGYNPLPDETRPSPPILPPIIENVETNKLKSKKSKKKDEN